MAKKGFGFTCSAAVLAILLYHNSQLQTSEGRLLTRRHHIHSSWPASGALPKSFKVGAGVSTIAIINPFPWCFEIVFGVVNSLQMIVKTIDVYADHFVHFEGTGAMKFLEGFHDGRIQPVKDFWDAQETYQIVIWTDHYGWEFEERRSRGPRDLLDMGFKGKIWLFNHEPNDVLWPLTCNCEEGQRWTKDPDYVKHSLEVFGHDQVEWFCIAPHVAAVLERLLQQHGIHKHVEWILPVFPWSNASYNEPTWIPSNFDQRKGFAIQGNAEAHRRNYSGLLQDVAGAAQLMQNERFELQLYSWGELDPEIVPATVVPKLVYKHLPFSEFYAQIHQTLGLMVLFPGDRYYRSASSSSIATAVSAGIPLIVDYKFLEVYTFILPAAVIVSHASSHAIAMEQVLLLTADQWTEASNMMALTREMAILRNIQVFTRSFTKSLSSFD